MATSKTKLNIKVQLTATAKKRLLRLAKLLREDARTKKGVMFDMGTWGDFKTPQPTMSCDTRACAFGLAAISGKFKREGLGFKVRTSIDEYPTHMMIFQYKGKPDPSGSTIAIAAKVFDIPHAVSDWLFGGSASEESTGAKAEREMASIIENAVKGKGIPYNVLADALSDEAAI